MVVITVMLLGPKLTSGLKIGSHGFGAKGCKRCKRVMDLVHLDVITPRTFDTTYYTNLMRKVGLLSTDQSLFSDARTAPFVEAFATQPFLFTSQFSVSMVKLGNVHVLTRPNEGEIRVNCNYVNTV